MHDIVLRRSFAEKIDQVYLFRFILRTSSSTRGPMMCFIVFILVCLTLTSWACGGLFCNARPVNQAAERILFAVEDDQINMVVQIQYQGPPSDFGWLLPVPADTEYALASEELFVRLDRNCPPI